MFCTICEHEIAFVLICSTGRTGRSISGSQLLQKTHEKSNKLSYFFGNMDLSGIHLAVFLVNRKGHNLMCFYSLGI